MLQINLTFNFGDPHYKFINLTNDTMHCEKIHTIKKKIYTSHFRVSQGPKTTLVFFHTKENFLGLLRPTLV